jgi:hypothetical protein
MVFDGAAVYQWERVVGEGGVFAAAAKNRSMLHKVKLPGKW